MDHTPVVALLGTPGTGADALAAALHQRLPPGTVQITPCTHAPEGAALILLMGLPPQASPEQEVDDAQLRAALAQAGQAYRVVYGHGEQQVEHALRAIKNISISAYPESAEATFESICVRLRNRYCDKCSDPECERRLFSELIRPAAPARA